MSLLANAKNSIELGLADFNSGDDKKLISSVRNFHAGVLLLLKEKLRRLSPANSNEVLIKYKVVPQLDSTGNLTFVGEGRVARFPSELPRSIRFAATSRHKQASPRLDHGEQIGATWRLAPFGSKPENPRSRYSAASPLCSFGARL